MIGWKKPKPKVQPFPSFLLKYLAAGAFVAASLITINFTYVMHLAWAAVTYYVSPTGNDTTGNGTQGNPWKSTTKALTVAVCGDTITYMNSVHGDGVSGTSKIAVSGVVCNASAHLILRALNSRQARIHDNGTGAAVSITNSAYIDIVGLVFNSTTTSPGATAGSPFIATNTDFVTVRDSLCRTPNKYANASCIQFVNSRDGLVESSEFYDIHRHHILLFTSKRMVVRLNYGTPRTGKISGGFGDIGSLSHGSSDSFVSMYPCDECIVENNIAEGKMYLGEQNATFNLSVLMKNSKYIGNICLNCTYGNGLAPNARGTDQPNLNKTPQILTFQHNAFPEYGSASEAIENFDGVGMIIDHNTVIGTGTGLGLVSRDNTAAGASAAQQSVVYTSNVVTGVAGAGFQNVSPATWSGSNNFSFGNGTSYSPSLPSNWSTGTASVTTNPGLGTCKAWPPDGSAAKIAGAGATILYRTVGGVTGTVQLWNQDTGEFPHGAIDLDGTNDPALWPTSTPSNVHERLNINRNGCSFPAGYVTGGGPPDPDPADVESGEGTTSVSFNHNYPVGTGAAVLGVGLYDDGGNVGTVNTITVDGNAATLIPNTSCVTANGTRRSGLYQRMAPGDGTRPVAVSTSGTVDYMVVTSLALADVASFHGGNCAVGLSSTPQVSATATNTGETLVSHLATKGSPTLSVGSLQTLALDTPHSVTLELRGMMSTKAGEDGVAMNDTLFGSAPYWAKSIASAVPNTPEAPDPVPVLKITKFLFHYLFGSEDAPVILPHAAAVDNTNISGKPNSRFRLRWELTASVANFPSTPLQVYCNLNGGSYARVMDSFGSNVFRLLGNNYSGNIPSSLFPLTQQLSSGNYTVGGFLRDESSVLSLAVPSGNKTEIETAIELNAAATNIIRCILYKDSGVALDDPDVTPTFTVTGYGAGM